MPYLLSFIPKESFCFDWMPAVHRRNISVHPHSHFALRCFRFLCVFCGWSFWVLGFGYWDWSLGVILFGDNLSPIWGKTQNRAKQWCSPVFLSGISNMTGKFQVHLPQCCKTTKETSRHHTNRKAHHKSHLHLLKARWLTSIVLSIVARRGRHSCIIVCNKR